MIMIYICKIVRFRKWKLLLVLGILSLGLGVKLILEMLHPTVAQLTELQKCPACYGLSACKVILSNRVKIRHTNVYTAFANLIGTKNVFFGTNDDKLVVLKKLAHSSELDAFDKMLCTEIDLADLCPKNTVEKRMLRKIDFNERIVQAVTSDFIADDNSNLRLCPNAAHLDNLFYKIYANNRNDRKTIFQAYLWTMIKINPEPLVLQILSADEGWPVPKYFGSCGRLIMEEYVGPSLTSYHHEPWTRRAKIASSLLKAVQMFTFRSTEFGFYFTDVSPDNIAVDSHDRVKFIDLENIIVVDKRVPLEDRASNWNDLQVNDANFECNNCLAFSPTDICSHHLSDHNYYAVCQHILARGTSATSIPGGFLNGIPQDILDQHPMLPDLIEQCAIPGILQTRIVVGDRLREVLDTIVERMG